MNKQATYRMLGPLFLRSPFYSFAAYDLKRMPDVVKDIHFQNAVILASPDFYRLIEKQEFNWEQLSDKARHTLRKYYNRMCFRPTPFGSFATFSLVEGQTGKDSTELAKDAQVLLHLRPDEHLLENTLTGISGLQEQTILIKNPLLYRFGRQFRFIRSEKDENGKHDFILDSLQAVPFYRSIFKLLERGDICLQKLRELVISEGACSATEADEHIAFLIKQQVLYSRSLGSPIGEGFRLLSHQLFWDAAGQTRNAGETLIASLQPGQDLSNRHNQLYYAAAERPVIAGGISEVDRFEMERAVGILQSLSMPAMPDALQKFRTAFKERFDQQKVPLLLALDPDSGINYDSVAEMNIGRDILKEVVFPAPEAEDPSLTWTAVHRFFLAAWKTVADPYAPIEITEEQLLAAELGDAPKTFPNFLPLMFRTSGETLIMDSAGGPNGPSLIARFGIFSEQVAFLAREIAALECAANPDVLFADIGHFSHAHVDNINRRQTVYPYEIPLNVFSETPQDAQLPPEDLLLSLQQGELVLESKKLGKRVVPRFASAFNYYNSGLGLFRMLCDLQYQGVQSVVSFDLERYFPGLNFYPRISSGRVVLSVAKWKFGEKDIALLLENGLIRFRKMYHLPSWVSMGHFDQQLIFNLDNRQDGEFLIACAGGLKQMTLLEYILPDRNVRAGYRPLAGQYVGFLYHERPVYQPLLKTYRNTESKVKRNFPPGSDCLYLKMYCTPLGAGIILEEVLRPFLNRFSELISSWFFIRYTDPGYHLRLRFYLSGAQDGGILLAGLIRGLEKSGHDRLVYALQSDTYQRELERYGVSYIERVEKVFWRGSELLLDNSDHHLMGGFIIALKMVNCFFKETEAAEFADLTAKLFLKEFKADKKTRISLDNSYRKWRPDLGAAISKEGTTKSMNNLLREVRELSQEVEHESDQTRRQLLGDLVHMQLNRTFPVDQRKQEMLVWYYLGKHLRSLTARLAKSNY